MSQKKHFKPVTSVPKGLTSRLGSKNKKYINTRKFTYRLSKTIQILRIQTCLSYLLSLPKSPDIKYTKPEINWIMPA